MHKLMRNRRWYPLLIPIAFLVVLQGCVANKKPTPAVEHQTLKGDNSTTKAMKGEVEMVESGFRALSDLTDRFAEDLAQLVAERRIYLDRANIRDANTRDVANFSTYLENELDASLSTLFQLVYEPSEADYLVGAVFQKYGSSIRIFFKYHKLDMTGRKSLDYSIERLRLPADSLKENLHSKAYKLAANIVPDQEELKLYINPVKLGSCDCVTDFSRSLTTLVRTEIVRLHPDLQVCAEKPIKGSGLSSIKKKAKEVAELQSTDAVFAGADTVMEGGYFVNGDTVMVNLSIKDLNGLVLSTASVDIDRAMIHTRLDNPTAEKLADLADKKEEDSGDVIKVTTTKGSGDPVYFEGEKINFLVQAKKPLYVYLYDITSKGDVALLYPGEAGARQQPLFPGRLQVIPEESDVYELEVTPPFGMDVVKVFASPVQLPIPSLNERVMSKSYAGGTRAILKKRKKIQKELSLRSTINPDDLVDYYRGLATQFGVAVFEDSLIVETRRQL